MDTSAFKRLYDQYAGKLFNFILWTTGNRSVCDDILQNVFSNIWQCDSVPEDSHRRKAWLFTVARNACMDHFRNSKHEVACRTRERERNNYHDRDDDGTSAWEAVQRLLETDRIIIFLHLKMGYDYPEIGAMLGMTDNCVRVRMCRALHKLRDILVRKGV